MIRYCSISEGGLNMNADEKNYLKGIYKNLTGNLKALRKMHSLSQETVSRRLNVSRKHYCQCENGSALPNLITLCLLADLYRIQLDALISSNLTREALADFCQNDSDSE